MLSAVNTVAQLTRQALAPVFAALRAQQDNKQLTKTRSDGPQTTLGPTQHVKQGAFPIKIWISYFSLKIRKDGKSGLVFSNDSPCLELRSDHLLREARTLVRHALHHSQLSQRGLTTPI